MPLTWIRKNKYKLMGLIVFLYLLADIGWHRGLTRVLIPKTFPAYKTDSSIPPKKNLLINTNKEWVKAVDTKELMHKINQANNGIECDVYFNRQKNSFEVHHDPDRSTGFTLIDLLGDYKQRALRASIWLDLKNLNDSNYLAALGALIILRDQYALTNKLLVESGRADLLTPFSDSGFFTSYYTPLFNPYLISNDEIRHWVDTLSSVISHSKVNALSGYYFQYPFLHQYFPNYPILTWATVDRFSLVNGLFKRKVSSAKEVFIILYP